MIVIFHRRTALAAAFTAFAVFAGLTLRCILFLEETPVALHGKTIAVGCRWK